MRKLFVLGLCLINTIFCCAQDSSSHELDEIVITGFTDSKIKATSLHLESQSLSSLETKSPSNLSDALAKLPGISQMTTGNSISKPVIRGLYGNRILVLLSGLRFDNQQFQDEHGLGLSQIGIDRIEVIRGPASLLYGTDAIGGVINVIEEKPVSTGENLNITTRLYSNTAGTLTDIGYSKRKGSSWYRLRGGIENNADYSDGNNTRVLNSRNKGYYVKAGFGFEKEKWIQNNSYNFSYNQYGFILDSLTRIYVDDPRLSRTMEGPHHNVMLNYFSSQNTILLPGSTLKVNAGIQSNKREEDEGSGQISLNMHLLSALENAKWEKDLSKNLLLVINQQLTYEHNTNLGKRILIPDANMAESNISAFLRKTISKVNIEIGVGYNYKNIQSFETLSLNSGNINTPDTAIKPFNIQRGAINTMLGASYTVNNHINIKGNVSTGNRAPNLAELSSNGLHEGTFRVELGNPRLEMEHNSNVDITVEADYRHFFLSISAYRNYFYNYIYLAQLTQTWLGFEQFRYVQQDARLYGGELLAIAKLSNELQLKETFSQTTGMLISGGYLPFIPANKSVSSIRFEKNIAHHLHHYYLEPELEYVFVQNHPAQFETATPSYYLFNIHSGADVKWDKRDFNINLSCKNILNKAYADHLSRLKYYGFYAQGINFVLSVHTKIGS